MIYLNLKIKKLYFTLKYFLILVLFFLVSVFFVSKSRTTQPVFAISSFLLPSFLF